MDIRLHEIELGSAELNKSKVFYQTVLGLQPVISKDGLNVFDAGTDGLDSTLLLIFRKA